MKSALDESCGRDAGRMASELADDPAEQRRLHGGLPAKGAITLASVQDFANKQGPFSSSRSTGPLRRRFAHWMGVLDKWKRMLGPDFDKAYAASNTIYVARQNNVLFSVLAQYFGPEAINGRLMLIETVSFTTTPEDMLDCARAHHRRPCGGGLFFGNYHLMDYELMGGDARKTHRRGEAAKRGKDAVPAAAGAVRLEAMADAHLRRPGASVPRRGALTLGRSHPGLRKPRRPY